MWPTAILEQTRNVLDVIVIHWICWERTSLIVLTKNAENVESNNLHNTTYCIPSILHTPFQSFSSRMEFALAALPHPPLIVSPQTDLHPHLVFLEPTLPHWCNAAHANQFYALRSALRFPLLLIIIHNMIKVPMYEYNIKPDDKKSSFNINIHVESRLKVVNCAIVMNKNSECFIESRLI